MASVLISGQARSAPDWTTSGFDAQRSSWVRADPYISIPNLTKFQFIWKLKVDNESRFANSLTAPVALGNLMTFRGFKSLVFVGGSSNNVYAIDYDFGTVFWRTHHNYAAGAREFAGSPACPGGMTVPLTRATPLVPPAQLAFFGFARPPRPAKGDIGEPGKGAPQLAEIAARLAARGNSGRGADTPATASPARGTAPARGAAAPSAPVAPNAPAAPIVPSTSSPRVVRPTNAVFSVAADGLLRGLIPDTGDLALAPARFLPANATATGLIWTEGFVYAATTNTCGGASEAVWAMDFASDAKPVVSWETGGAPVAGIAVGPEGAVYAATGSGTSQYASSIVALDGATLTVRDWVTRESGFTSAPVVFTEGQKSYVTATSDGRLYVFAAASLGGANHRAPLAMTADAGLRFAPDGLATWHDESGTRWVLAALGDAIAGFKVVDKGGTPSIERAWTSRTMVSPRAPIIVNGVVFALAGGNANANATLYALDPSTGKDLWTSGSTITGVASAGLSAGTGQVYVVTSDNTVWSFGIPLAIN
ncbi:MAG TPA: PQQ-binding-like beta-propeller repeat protein [Vicinamibacterales bacterium]|nr:PQQ-binding-like beta-propeller repeat protein [Vicinamibacterales bacterium]